MTRQTMKHTPGPWVARPYTESEWEVVKNDPLCIDGVWYIADCHGDADGASSEANARLIAMAPIFLKALQDIANLPEADCEKYVAKADAIAFEALAIWESRP